MALLENWTDIVDGETEIAAEEINALAHAIQEAGRQIDAIPSYPNGDEVSY